MDKKQTIIIGIAGASGSGKSLFANTIINELGSNKVAVVSEDSYYKPFTHLSMQERVQINFDHPDAFDYDLMIAQLKELQAGKTVQVPIYSHAKYDREKETKTVGQHTIIVLEGILLFANPNLREMMDIRIFMDTPLDICFIRRLLRDVKERGRTTDSVSDQYQKTVRPMYLQFIEPSKQHADISVLHGGQNRIAIDMIKAKMRELLDH